MPKLSKAAAKKVDNADSGFDPLDDGVYHARLRTVAVSENPGPSGSHYWKWEFEVVEAPYENRRLWTNTSLAESAAFKLNEMFDAFGVSSDTDTDELIGDVVKLVVTTRIINEGSRKGEPSNQIDRVAKASDDFEAPESKGGGSAEDLF